MANTRARSGRTGRFVRLDERGRVTLGKLGHQEDPTYLLIETSDGTVVLIPARDWTDAEFDLICRPDVQELLKPGRGPVFDSPTDSATEPDTDALACLAMRQAGVWGAPSFDAEVDHPRFEAAVQAATAAASDEHQAFQAARSALVDSPRSQFAAAATPTDQGPSGSAETHSLFAFSSTTTAFLEGVSHACISAPGDVGEIAVDVDVSPDGHLASFSVYLVLDTAAVEPLPHDLLSWLAHQPGADSRTEVARS